MIQDSFQFYKPCKTLLPYIRYYWVFKSDQILNTFTFPIGCPQIIFHKKTPLLIPELGIWQDTITISGQVNFSSHIYTNGHTEMIVVVFQLHTLNLFLNIPTNSFYNQEVFGFGIENKSLIELSKRILDCEDNNLCIQYIEKWLLLQVSAMRMGTEYKFQRINEPISQILKTSQVSVNELSSMACLSKKQFEREFKTFVGMGPKEYTHIVRLQKALSFLQHQKSTGINHAQIALASGYADQSHYIREFKKHCGYTPRSLLEMTSPYSDLFTHPV